MILFLFLLALQTPRVGSAAYLEAKEKAVAAHPDDVAAREEAVRAYWDYGQNSGMPVAQVIAARRKHIAWLVEHHPEATVLGDMRGTITPDGSYLPDPAGYAEIARLWKQKVASAGAPTLAIVQAAHFFRLTDRTTAFAISDRVWPSQQNDPEVARLRATLDILEMMGATHWPNPADIVGDTAAFDSPKGRQARQELKQSTNIAFLLSAGETVLQFAHVSFMPTGAGPDMWKEAEQWLAHAHQLDPKNNTVSDQLAGIISRQAMFEPNKQERVKLQRRALELSASDEKKPPMLWALANYELEAGNKEAAERDARQLLALAERGVPGGAPSMDKFLADQARKIIEKASK